MRAGLILATLSLGCPDRKPPDTVHDPPAYPVSEPDDSGTPSPHREFADPATCGSCHPLQYAEWRGSIMHYSAISPTFNAFELVNRVASHGDIAPNGANPSFCLRCHGPIGVYNKEFSDYIAGDLQVPAIDEMSAIAAHGISCDFCHRVTGPDLDQSLLGDGIANTALDYTPGAVKQGPIEAPVESPYHDSEGSEYLQSPEFCGACHDVRLLQTDVETGEPFSRLENLFTEWQSSPWAGEDNPMGEVVTCQDCHMSLYPLEPPGTYPQARVAVALDAPIRRHTIHAFTAVSIPLTESVPFPDRMPDFELPNIDTDDVDEFGYPRGQAQRREQMLQAACTVSLAGTRLETTTTATVLPIRVTVENVGAGHNVPSGFSQEREVWIELTVSDEAGTLYTSGHLVDSAHPETGEDAPDGLLHDEELDHGHFEMSEALGFETLIPGLDEDKRPEENLGLVNFQNALVHVDDDGQWHEISDPMMANHMDNSHSLAPFEPTVFKYDVPLLRAPSGAIEVRARLRYRAFPPHFLRTLAAAVPDLVDEAMVDRNTIVNMASDTLSITVATP